MTAATLSRGQIQAAIDAATRDLPPAERVAAAERMAREVARSRRRTRYPTPGALAHKIDPLTTVETPMLAALDAKLVDAFERFEAGQAVRLGVFAPPQEGKSRRVTIWGILWGLLRNPELRCGIASFESEVASGFSAPIRNAIAEFGSGTPLNPRPLADDLLGITLRMDSTSRSRFALAGHAGGVVAVGMKGGLTSRPLDVLVIDDPYKDRELADNADHRRKIEDWYRNVAIPRMPSASLVILVQTRWHPDDLAGYVIKTEAALPPEARTWEFFNVPAQAERPRTDDRGWLPDSLGREPGEYMLSARGRTDEEWAARRTEVGEMVWGSLYQQHPTPPTGAVFAYEHITRNRRPADWSSPAARRAVAVDTSAGGADEAGLIAGYRGTDGRAYITHDRSRAMSSAEWAFQAWLLVLDTGADDLVWEQNLAGPTMRADLDRAWARIVHMARTLDAVDAETAVRALTTREEPDEARVQAAATRWAAEEQRLPIGQAEPSPDEVRHLREVAARLDLLKGALDASPPARLIPVTATTGKRIRATPVAIAYETNKVSHVGVLAALEAEQTQWQEGPSSPGRLDADVWLVTHLLAVRRGRTSTSAGTTLPTTTPR